MKRKQSLQLSSLISLGAVASPSLLVGQIPHGNIHWAGTETSERWNGYMEGAIRSGERVSKEIAILFNK